MGNRTVRFKIRGDRFIWLMVIFFCMISLTVVYSSSSSLAIRNDTTPFNVTIKQFISFVIGYAGLFICYLIPLKLWRKFSYLMLLLAGLFLIAAIVTPDPRHIIIGNRTLPLQPSELAKVAAVLYLGRILEISRMDTFKEYMLRVLIPLGGLCALTLMGSVSATLIILLVSGTILVCSGIKWSYLGYTALICIVAGGIAVGIFYTTDGKVFDRIGTAISRVERHLISEEEAIATMSPEELKDYNDKKEQSRHAREAIQLGGITGRGPGNGLKKFVLPNAYDDYVFATIVEETGLMGATVIMILYVVFFSRCIAIAKMCSKTFTTVTVLGLGLLIVLQAFLHICVNVGLLPVTGQTLPLISNGGTSIVILSCAVGIILSVNRTIEVTEEKGKITARQQEEEKNREEERIRMEMKKIG